MTSGLVGSTGAVPEELTARAHWVCWLSGQGGQRAKKLPICPATGGPASVSDPATWGEFAAAARAGYDGPGFVFRAGGGLVGVDLDGCRDPKTGRIAPWAEQIIRQHGTYTEVSPSGTGVKLFGAANVRLDWHRAAVPESGLGGRKAGIECYSEQRFFTVTGQHLTGTPRAVRCCEVAIRELQERLALRAAAAPQPAPEAPGVCLLPDAEILRLAGTAKNGGTFGALWSGEWQGRYPSQSEADQALCNLLAFWTGGDRTAMDRLFRQSGLYRPKWERLDYREGTISRAISGCRSLYQPGRGGDPGAEALVADCLRCVNEPVTVRQICNATGLRSQIAGRALLSLVRSGKVAYAKPGALNVYWPTERLLTGGGCSQEAGLKASTAGFLPEHCG